MTPQEVELQGGELVRSDGHIRQRAKSRVDAVDSGTARRMVVNDGARGQDAAAGRIRNPDRLVVVRDA